LKSSDNCVVAFQQQHKVVALDHTDLKETLSEEQLHLLCRDLNDVLIWIVYFV
jgi:hypothetical protein